MYKDAYTVRPGIESVWHSGGAQLVLYKRINNEEIKIPEEQPSNIGKYVSHLNPDGSYGFQDELIQVWKR